MKYFDSILGTLGETPLVQLSRVGQEVPGLLLAKMEQFNPAGSVKDRIGLRLIESCERDGRLKPGGVIVEPTSGNTGAGLAMAAAIKNYRCIFVMTDKASEEKRNLLRAYGAEVVVCPSSVSADDPASYQSVAARLAKEIPGACSPNQYSNPANPETHVLSTGPEIWRDTDGKITHFVAGIGTAGTIVGVAKYLKSKNPDIVIVGADPEGSVYSGDTPKPYKVEGIGMDHFPDNYVPSLVDRFVRVTDAASFAYVRQLARTEGILAGPSCGTALAAAVEVGKEAGPNAVIVVLFPDSGRAYLSKAFNETWLRENGLSESQPSASLRDLLASRSKLSSTPAVLSVAPEDSAMKAIELTRVYGISQIPVIFEDRIVGSLTESQMIQKLAAGEHAESKTAKDWMGPAIPELSDTAAVQQAYTLFASGQNAIAVRDSENKNTITAVITKSDLLEYWSENS